MAVGLETQRARLRGDLRCGQISSKRDLSNKKNKRRIRWEERRIKHGANITVM